ncbi:hypothetical protein EVAR_22947_1 [Eumeta japonica]|uniref:Secreted protein n=1 Tax=Eumeta variegata TaxID=151549 RepID=A0A4C1UR81_EUMVA|nr:hypothetical protein EVAR_22947_1 [Eumeta japonica]
MACLGPAILLVAFLFRYDCLLRFGAARPHALRAKSSRDGRSTAFMRFHCEKREACAVLTYIPRAGPRPTAGHARYHFNCLLTSVGVSSALSSAVWM